MRAGWIIGGVVQGVGFRNFVQRRAAELGLRGWVRNLPDGRVEVAASGNEGQLVTLEQYLQAGPRYSHIESVEKIEISGEVDSVKSFEVR
jgi:acylphosphatase